jgi:DNA-binding SARP family transcriptional activator/predicted ATPase
MAHLSLSLLGTFEVILAGQPITTFEYDKVRALLAYLAVEADRPHRRETLAGLLWPERPERSAHQNLSQALFKLRHAIGDHEVVPPFLQITPQTLQFNPSSDYQLDVSLFTTLITACQQHDHQRLATCEMCIERLQQAVTLYRGNFLEGFSLADSPAFEEWSLLKREWLHRLALEALGQLASYFKDRAEYEAALRYAWRQVELEPWYEEGHCQLIQLLALDGQRGAALAQYEVCCRLLAEELGVEPTAEMKRLYEQIRTGSFGKDAQLISPLPLSLPAPQPVSAPPLCVVREAELARLDDFLHKALAGQGRVVFVTGGPGRGKTILIQAFARQAQAAHSDLLVVGGKGNAYTGAGDPYLPFREVLEQLTGDMEAIRAVGVITPEQADRLQQLLPRSSQILLEVGPDLIGTFLSGEALLRRAAAYPPPSQPTDWLVRLKQHLEKQTPLLNSSPRLQSNLFEQYTRLLRMLADQNPILLFLDDLQWADLSSINLLFHLGRRLEGSRILIVGAYRPAEIAAGGQKHHPLEPVVNEFKRQFGAVEIDLSQTGTRRFVDALLDTEPNCLGAAFRQTLYRQTGGHPLFTVELLRGMQERGDLVQDQTGRWIEGPALDWETLPARVEAVIAERIDWLPESLREILTVASVEGETFMAEVVARVRAAEPQKVVHHLSDQLERVHRLVVAQGVCQQADQHLSLYRFRHFLFQKYLYTHLDPAERVYLHEAVGLALEQLYGEATDEVAVQLARHFQEAGLVGKAITYLYRAGEQAVRLSANEEAIAHFRRALALLETLPVSPERARQEIDLQLALAVPYLVSKGYGAPEVGQAYTRAQELCQQVEDTTHLFPVLWVSHSFYGSRGEFQKSYKIAERFFNLAKQTQDPLLVAQAHYMLGTSQFYLGRLAPARSALEQIIGFYDPQQHRDLVLLYGHDIGVDSLSWLSWALWLLGYPDQAWQRSQEALALAEKLEHPLTQACALGFASMIFYNCCRNPHMIQDLAETCIRLSVEQGFPYWLAHGMICRGWARAKQGAIEAGLAEMRQGLIDRTATGVELAQSLFLAILAEAYGKAGQTEAGLSLLAETLEIICQRQERFYEAEIYRLKGELLVQTGAETEAEACFLQAVEIARQQQAKSLELRATLSLGRLWQKQELSDQAKQMLAEIYGWFSEGFDTADLQEARTLLAELSTN